MDTQTTQKFKPFTSKRMTRLAGSQIMPYYDGTVVGIDYYLKADLFIRFTGVHDKSDERIQFPLLSALGIGEGASFAKYQELVLDTTNRERIVDSFRKAGGSVCLNSEQRQTFEDLFADGRFAAEKVELYGVRPNSGKELLASPVDLDNETYEMWLDFASEQSIGYFVSYQDDLDAFKEARFDFNRKISDLEMDENFLNRRMRIKLFKKQFNFDVAIPRQHIQKKVAIATVVTVASLFVGAIGHMMLHNPLGGIGMKVGGAVLKAAGSFGAIFGRSGFWTLVRDFEDRPVVLFDGDRML